MPFIFIAYLERTHDDCVHTILVNIGTIVSLIYDITYFRTRMIFMHLDVEICHTSNMAYYGATWLNVQLCLFYIFTQSAINIGRYV